MKPSHAIASIMTPRMTRPAPASRSPVLRRVALMLAAGVATAGAVATAQAQVSINVGIGTPVYTSPPPVVVSPRPVYVAPPPVVYRGRDRWGRDRPPPVVVRHPVRHDEHRDHHGDHRR
ncbi:hypothetical protein [Bordetella genomosp. 9]|nr:hypothetical protein [Bordetella genomosp. 9]